MTRAMLEVATVLVRPVTREAAIALPRDDVPAGRTRLGARDRRPGVRSGYAPRGWKRSDMCRPSTSRGTNIRAAKPTRT